MLCTLSRGDSFALFIFFVLFAVCVTAWIIKNR